MGENEWEGARRVVAGRTIDCSTGLGGKMKRVRLGIRE
jgi:hypothetical protein